MPENPHDLIATQVEAINLGSEIVSLTCHIVHAADDGTGVYRDVCLQEIARIRARLGRIEAFVESRPARREVA